jgi:ADP-ribose pyrophosphatase YjhB (NUDIX family)
VLLLRYDYPGGAVFGLPGGSPEGEESLEEALLRECAEELGIRIALEGILMVAESEANPRTSRTVHVLFRARLLEGIPRPRPEETSADGCLWLPLEELPLLDLYPNAGSLLLPLLETGIPSVSYVPTLPIRPWK